MSPGSRLTRSFSSVDRSPELLAAVGATVLYSAGNLIVRGAPLEGIQLAFLRTVLGAIIYQVVLRARGGKLTWAGLRSSLPGAFGWAMQAMLFYTAVKSTTLASATVLAALQPLMIVPIARRRYAESYSMSSVLLILMAIFGTGLVVSSSASSGSWSLAGDVMAFVATGFGCMYFVGTKTARGSLDPVEYQASLLLISVVIMFPFTLIDGVVPTGFSPGDLVWPLALALVPGTGHLMMSWAQHRLSVATTSMLILDVVPLTALGGAVFYSEPIGWSQGLGICVVVAALGFFVRSASAN